MKPKNSPIFAWAWLLLSIVLTIAILSFLYIPDIILFDDSCSYSSIDECNKDAIEKAKNEIKKLLPKRIEKLLEIRKTIPILNLLPPSYVFFIVNSESGLQLEISYPKNSFPVGDGLSACYLNHEPIFLKKGEKIKFATLTFTDDIKKDTDNILDKFGGCYFVATEKSLTYSPPRGTIVGPNETISLKIIMKPLLKVEINKFLILAIFFGVFASIGALFALLRQFIKLAEKGMLYFTD